jgi:hypothetical protein
MSRTLPDSRHHMSLCPSPHPQGTARHRYRSSRIYVHGSRSRTMVLAPSTYTDENNTVWNILEFTSPTHPNEIQNHRAPSPVTSIVRPASQLSTQGTIPEPSQRAILRAPNTVPPQPIHKYDLRSRRGAASAKHIHRNYRADCWAYAAVLPIPEAYIPPALNLDVNGKPLRLPIARLKMIQIVCCGIEPKPTN